jgi:hypothetical protein
LLFLLSRATASATLRSDAIQQSVTLEPWTLADLTRENKLAREKTTLKEVILG